MKLLRKIYFYIRAIPKTLFFNFYYLPFSQAIKLPIIVCHKTRFESLRGQIILDDDPKFARIRLGFGRIQTIDSTRARFIWRVGKHGKIHLAQNVKLGVGCKLHVDGDLHLGPKCNFTGDVTIICKKQITFKGHCLVSWQTLFMDTDFHPVIDKVTEQQINVERAITISEHTWFGTRSTITKGTHISSNCIVAAGSILTGKHYPPNVYLGGNPAKVIGDMKGKYFTD